MIELFFSNGLPDDLKAYGLVMPEAVRDSLIQKQDEHGNPRHRLSPVQLTDGRWALSADVLAEATPSGIFGSVEFLDEQNIAQVEVTPWPNVLALLPQPDPMDL